MRSAQPGTSQPAQNEEDKADASASRESPVNDAAIVPAGYHGGVVGCPAAGETEGVRCCLYRRQTAATRQQESENGAQAGAQAGARGLAARAVVVGVVARGCGSAHGRGARCPSRA